MTVRNFICKGLLPIAALALLTYLGQYIFVVNGQIDWFRACMVYGIPFGIPYMLIVIPIGENPSTSVIILVFNIIIGALFGCVIALIALVRSAFYIIGFVMLRMKRIILG